MRRLVITGVVALGFVLWVVDVEAGYRGPFEGRVVDKDTLQPIQGAVVFVEWKKEKLTPVHPVQEYYDAAEVRTNEKGEFYISKKWSWNPWTNLMAYSRVILFKAGYGAVTISHWPGLKELVEEMKTFDIETRRKAGPELYFDIQFEERSFRRDFPIFLLKKLTSKDERLKNRLGLDPGSKVPQKKKDLLIREIEHDQALSKE